MSATPPLATEQIAARFDAWQVAMDENNPGHAQGNPYGDCARYLREHGAPRRASEPRRQQIVTAAADLRHIYALAIGGDYTLTQAMQHLGRVIERLEQATTPS